MRRRTNNKTVNAGMLLWFFWYLVIAALFNANEPAQAATQPNVNGTAAPKVKTMSVQVFVYLFDKEQYAHTVLPAYQAFTEKAETNPLVKLLKDAIPRLGSIRTGYGEPGLSQKVYESYIATLTGKEYYSSEGKEPKKGDSTTPEDMRILVDNEIAPELLQVFCLPRNLEVKPEQGMSTTALMTYLYSQSRWIEDYFTGSKQVKGSVPEIKLGEWSQFFSDEEVAAFDNGVISNKTANR